MSGISQPRASLRVGWKTVGTVSLGVESPKLLSIKTNTTMVMMTA